MNAMNEQLVLRHRCQLLSFTTTTTVTDLHSLTGAIVSSHAEKSHARSHGRGELHFALLRNAACPSQSVVLVLTPDNYSLREAEILKN